VLLCALMIYGASAPAQLLPPDATMDTGATAIVLTPQLTKITGHFHNTIILFVS
jgi:hypothetical protein